MKKKKVCKIKNQFSSFCCSFHVTRKKKYISPRRNIKDQNISDARHDYHSHLAGKKKEKKSPTWAWCTSGDSTINDHQYIIGCSMAKIKMQE